MAKNLTSRQQQVFDCLTEFIAENGFPPSIRELGELLDIGSLRGVTIHLDALQKKGFIERNSKPRSIRITHPSFARFQKSSLVPLLGEIAAGQPILATEHVEDMIPVPEDMVERIENPFLLRVKGDSMTGDGIMPRDLVIVKPQKEVRSHELGALLVHDEATVKRLELKGRHARLHSSNPEYDVINVEASEVSVMGKIVGLMRDYEGMAF